MIVPGSANALMLGGASDYRVSRSLRFRMSSLAHLSRTPSSAGNRQIWTWSGWVKRGDTANTTGSGASTELVIFGSGTNTNGGNGVCSIGISQDRVQAFQFLSGVQFTVSSTQVLRDYSAWYHLVFTIDTTQATASNRVRMWINGVQVTSFSDTSYPSLNYSTGINSTDAHNICRRPDGQNYFGGYLAEVNFIDGQALTPASFGKTDAVTGQWNPIRYTGTYGTNGFYLDFADPTSATTLAQDKSGRGNNWTPNNISVSAGATYDSMIDSPTAYSDGGNYCVLNPLNGQNSTLQNANLSMAFSSGGGTQIRVGTFGITTGKWYWEGQNAYSGGTQDPYIGVVNSAGEQSNVNPDGSANAWALVPRTDTNVVNKANGTTKTQIFSGVATTDVYMVALDADAGKIWFGKNGVWAESGDPAAGTNPQWSNLSTGPYYPLFRGSGAVVSGTLHANFGQRPFAYTPPTGFRALHTGNLPEPSIKLPNKWFDATLYTGNGGTLAVSNGNFAPDLVWLKGRSVAYSHGLFDTARGATKKLSSNLTDAEVTQSGLTAFDAAGFTLGSDAGTNQSGASYVAWQWKEGATPGFDVVTYTGNGVANRAIAHSLGVAPRFAIIKARNLVEGWLVYSGAFSAPNDNLLVLNNTGAMQTASGYYGTTAWNGSNFYVGSANALNQNGGTFVAYLFAEVPGFSRFGSYTGNGSSDGPFVFCGFRPRYVLIKRTDDVDSWVIEDSSRDTYNVDTKYLLADSSGAEGTGTPPQLRDLLSNGFKVRSTNQNASGGTYIYAAFAESPFRYSRAR